MDVYQGLSIYLNTIRNRFCFCYFNSKLNGHWFSRIRVDYKTVSTIYCYKSWIISCSVLMYFIGWNKGKTDDETNSIAISNVRSMDKLLSNSLLQSDNNKIWISDHSFVVLLIQSCIKAEIKPVHCCIIIIICYIHHIEIDSSKL